MVNLCTTTPKGATSVYLLTLVSAFALTACGGGGGGDASTTPTESGSPPTESLTPTEHPLDLRPALDLPPAISGTPVNAIVHGRTYTFVAVAQDPEGKAVSFSIVNKPAWASFDSATGTLQGTPEAGDVGTYPGIAISVTDGLHAVALRPFSIDVIATATGSIVVNWVAPTERDDGSPLTDLAGYNLRWGTAVGHYPNLATIPNPGIATYVIDELSPGTYYLVATAYDARGVESDYSNVAMKTIL
jgi:hypothetical protein